MEKNNDSRNEFSYRLIISIKLFIEFFIFGFILLFLGIISQYGLLMIAGAVTIGITVLLVWLDWYYSTKKHKDGFVKMLGSGGDSAKAIGLFICGVVIFLYVFFFSCPDLYSRLEYNEIVDSTVTDIKTNDGYSWGEVTFEYEYNGKKYTVNNNVESSKLKIGDKKKVYITKNNPLHMYLPTHKMERGEAMELMFLGAAILLIYVIAFIKKLRIRYQINDKSL